jgi:hypothetical protein
MTRRARLPTDTDGDGDALLWSRAVSRRAFLTASGGLLLVAACGGSGGGSAGGGEVLSHAKGLSALLLASDLYASPSPQRIAFALADGARFASGPPARIAFGPQGQQPGAFVDTVLHDRGLPKARGIYTAPITLPSPGVWVGVVEVNGNKRVPLSFQVQDKSAAPVAGQPAPRAASPTLTNPMGVDPICTRDPPCPLHRVSLDTVIGVDKPVALLFATPARCQSRYCGPVLDDLLNLVNGFRDRITFVHVEIYTSRTGNDLVPTLAAWGIQTEPWLFGIDAHGTVVSRLDGAFGADEQQPVLQELAS